MGTKVRALGADSVLIGVTESTYGTSPVTGYQKLIFKACSLDSEQPLGYDPLLGQGRSGLDPYYDAINVDGDIDVPLDVRGIGFWLHGLMGTPVSNAVSATGTITFSALPANNSTITLGGTVWTFVTSGATGPQTNIGGSVSATMTTLATNLNSSVDTQIAKVTYTGTTTGLSMVHDVTGATGNIFTLVASANSNGTVSAATLRGGGTSHVFTAGGDIPSKTLEVGRGQLTTPLFHRFAGVNFGGLSFDMTRRGPVNGKINLIGQSRTVASTTIDGSAATPPTLQRFNQGQGAIKLGGTQIASVTAGNFTYTNNLTAVETIRADGKIDGVDAGEARSTGSITVRVSVDATLRNAVEAQTPVALQYSFISPELWSFTIDLPRVFLPKPKGSITGPGGIDQVFDWQSALDSGTGVNTKITIVNDVTAYS